MNVVLYNTVQFEPDVQTLGSLMKFQYGSFLFLGIGLTISTIVGCNGKAPSPVAPSRIISLNVSLPRTQELQASLLGSTSDTLLYTATSASGSVTGSAGPFSDQAGAGAIDLSLNLPSSGTWLLALELLEASDQKPLALGAAQFDTGTITGPITIEMGSVSRNCYQTDTWMDPGGSSFSFETDNLSAGVSSSLDIYFAPTAGAFQIQALGSDKIQYMGNGPLVNYAAAPTTETATLSSASKTAAGASNANLQTGDVYCVLLSGGGHAWMQINSPGSSIIGPSFRYRVNTTLPYYAYERTTADLSGICLTPVYTPTPSYTFTPTITFTPTSTNTPTITPTPIFTYTFTPTLTGTPTATPQPKLILSWIDQPASQTYLFDQADVTGIQISLTALGQEPISVTKIAFGLNGSITSGEILPGSVRLIPDTVADDPAGNGVYVTTAVPTPIVSGTFTNGAVTFSGLTNLIVSPGAPQTFLLVMSLNATGAGNLLTTAGSTSIQAFGANTQTTSLVYGGPFNGNLHNVLGATTTPTLTATNTATSTGTPSLTMSPTFTTTQTPTNTPTNTTTQTPTDSATNTATPSPTNTPTVTMTPIPTVYIPDLNLLNVIQNVLLTNNIHANLTDPIYPADMASITSLYANSDSIVSLEGLEYCTGMTTLQLENNAVTDLSPISGLTGLTYLDLWYNQQITSFTPLSLLTGLQQLYLGNNNLSDLSFLPNLINLQDLDLTYNSITDMSPVTNLVNLQNLYIYSNQITTVPDLTAMTQLSYLDMDSNYNLADISGLAGAGNLNYLNLDYTSVADLSSLSNLRRLNDIELDGTSITDLGSLVTLAQGEVYNVYLSILNDPNLNSNTNVPTQILTLMSDNWTVNFRVNIPDSALYGAVFTTLENNGVINGDSIITPADMATLTSLTAEADCITSLEGLEYCTSLTSLDLQWNTISDLTPISNLTGLTSLNLESNSLSDISLLAGMTGLTELNLDNNQITDPSPLASLTGLIYLGLDVNQITDFSSLTTLRGLNELDLSSNLITTIPEGFYMPQAFRLYLEYNQITDLQPLVDSGEINGTAWLYLYGDPLTNLNVPAELQQLAGDGWTVYSWVTIPDPNLLSAVQSVLVENEIISNTSVPITPADMAAITSLTDDDNGVTNLQGLQYCTGMTYLELEYNNITDLSPIANLSGLYSLDLYYNNVSDLTALTDITSLTYLELDGNPITDLTPLLNNSGLIPNRATISLLDITITPTIYSQITTLENDGNGCTVYYYYLP